MNTVGTKDEKRNLPQFNAAQQANRYKEVKRIRFGDVPPQEENRLLSSCRCEAPLIPLEEISSIADVHIPSKLSLQEEKNPWQRQRFPPFAEPCTKSRPLYFTEEMMQKDLLYHSDEVKDRARQIVRLCKYATVVALIKLTSTSALCVFQTLEGAARAISSFTSLQTSKLLIVSWWYPRFACAKIRASLKEDEEAVTNWLKGACEEVRCDKQTKLEETADAKQLRDFTGSYFTRPDLLPLNYKPSTRMGYYILPGARKPYKTVKGIPKTPAASASFRKKRFDMAALPQVPDYNTGTTAPRYSGRRQSAIQFCSSIRPPLQV